VPETMRIFELLKELQRSKQKFAIVVDEFGGITGVVTMEDIIEEIVGEIHDEYDTDTEQIVEEKDYLVVKGDTDISELSDRLEVKLEEDEDYQTVAGLMSYKLGRIPGKKDTITIENYIFEVIDMEKNRVKKVKITKEG
jgi:CBS domain containing-hemolysin-like protein